MVTSELAPEQSLEQWHDAIASIITDGVNDATVDNLVDAIRLLISGDGCSLIVYPKDTQPYCQYRKRADGGDPKAYIDQYLDRAYLLDPFYRMAIDSPGQPAEGVYSLKDVAPNGFEHNGMYLIYYQLVNFGDEICVIIPTDDNATMQISISRQNTMSSFSTQQMALIEQLFSTVRAILLKWWTASSETRKQTFLKSHLESALAHFGSSVLTVRETQVLQLKLRGYATKYIAQKLGITPETIKHHRKNIYAKLDINSQAEMFHLFIDSLRMVTPDSPDDPLANYLRPIIKKT